MMNIEVRYQSRGGNTKAVAEEISKEFNIECKTIENPITEYVDVLFIGGGVYKWDADENLITFLKQLDSKKVGKVVAFSTTGAMKVAITRIREYSEKAGIEVSDNELLLKMMLQGHSALGRVGGNLTDEQKDKIKVFCNNVKSELARDMKKDLER